MKPILRVLVGFLSILLTVMGALLSAVGGVIRFNTEMIDGYLTPLVKLISSGSGTGADIWTLYNYTSTALIGLGIVMSLIGIFGCLLSLCPSKSHFIMHMVVVTIMICVQVTAVGILLTTDIKRELVDTLRSNLVKDYSGDTALDDISVGWNYAFVEFSCCGAENYTELVSAVKWNRTIISASSNSSVAIVPTTCCKLPEKYPNFGEPIDENCTQVPTVENSNIADNCYEKINDYLWYYGLVMSGCLGVAIFFEMLCLLVDILASRYMKRRHGKIKPNPDKP